MGVSDRGDVQIAAHLCKGCCLCVAACPPAVLAQSSFLNRQGYYAVSYKGTGCTGCGVCFYICPEPGAITVRKRMQAVPASSKPGSTTSSTKPMSAAQ
jgi:NAD-dependent dihydropyrimidine dehydrogenase PreA subunit